MDAFERGQRFERARIHQILALARNGDSEMYAVIQMALQSSCTPATASAVLDRMRALRAQMEIVQHEPEQHN